MTAIIAFDLIKKKINFAKIFKLGSTNFIKRKTKKIKENDYIELGQLGVLLAAIFALIFQEKI